MWPANATLLPYNSLWINHTLFILKGEFLVSSSPWDGSHISAQCFPNAPIFLGNRIQDLPDFHESHHGKSVFSATGSCVETHPAVFSSMWASGQGLGPDKQETEAQTFLFMKCLQKFKSVPAAAATKSVSCVECPGFVLSVKIFPTYSMSTCSFNTTQLSEGSFLC